MREAAAFAHYTHGSLPLTGVLLVNLGTPEAPTPEAVRRYLAEFLADPRVVEAPRWLWWLVLHGVILRVRPAPVAKKYQHVWTGDGSPLLAISRRQREALTAHLEARFGAAVKVVLAMRYGQPSLRAGLERLRQANARRILVLPLYPQYSATTTGSTFDAVAGVLRDWRWLPELRMVNHYHDFPPYIEAVAASIRASWHGREPAERLLFSFHGIPERYYRAGDPYPCECRKTARLVAEALQLPAERWALSFQSRFGREPWVQPYTDHTLQAWGQAGVRSVEVVCPGFSADCLETLEEIGLENRDLFLSAGGDRFHYIPALNDSPLHVQMLTELVSRHLQGWPESAPGWDPLRVAEEAEASRHLALAEGALD